MESPAPSNDTFLRAIAREPTPYTPIWLMRQAGRYLPEYNVIRRRAGSFLDLVRNPNLATEVTLQPLERFDLDAAIVFSDILTVPDAMGLRVEFPDGGPRFEAPLRDENAIRALQPVDLDRLEHVFEAIRQTRHALHNRVPLIGFCGSPWTLACYMVEGQGSTDFHIAKRMLYERPDLMHRILAANARSLVGYLGAQVDAGAQALMVFDSWGGILPPDVFREFSLAYIEQVLSALAPTRGRSRLPIIVFSRGASASLEDIARVGADAVGVDWTLDIGDAKRRIGARCALQGNLDPSILLAGDTAIREHATRVLDTFRGTDGSQDGHIFNLGHGVSPETPPESVALLVDTVHDYSRRPLERA